MCQQGESVVSKHPDIMFISNQTPNRGWPNNVCCDAAQICPAPGFEHVCTVSCCVWSPTLCKRGVCKHGFFKVSALRWVGCLLLPVSCGSRALPLCLLLQCRVCFAAVGCSGLVRATKLVNRQRFPTPPGVYSNYSCVYNVLTLFGSTPSLPQVHLVHPPGFL